MRNILKNSALGPEAPPTGVFIGEDEKMRAAERATSSLKIATASQDIQSGWS